MKLHVAQDYLQSLIDEESEEEEIAAVYIQPPDPAYDSAEDDADEIIEILVQFQRYSKEQMVVVYFHLVTRCFGAKCLDTTEKSRLQYNSTAISTKYCNALLQYGLHSRVQ